MKYVWTTAKTVISSLRDCALLPPFESTGFTGLVLRERRKQKAHGVADVR